MRVTSAHRGRTTGDVSSRLPVPGRGVSRWDLDAALAAAARGLGAEVREGARVRAVESSGRRVTVSTAETTLAAQAALVATGRLARPRGAGERSRSASRAWRGVKVHVRGLSLPSLTELHFVAGAYVGLNEVVLGGEIVVNVCALATAPLWESAGANLDGLLASLARESPAFAARHERFAEVSGSRAAVASFDFDRRGAVADLGPGARPALVVGDAAASIVPLAGDGQAMALSAGRDAARLLLEQRSPDDTLQAAAVQVAARRWRRRFGRAYRVRLAAGRAVQAALLRPRGARALLGLARCVTPVPGALFRLTRGPLPRPTP